MRSTPSFLLIEPMRFPIHDLSELDFGKLCRDLLNAEGWDLTLNIDQKDFNIYITGKMIHPDEKPKTIGIGIIKKDRLDKYDLITFKNRLDMRKMVFDEYMYITQRRVTNEERRLLNDERASWTLYGGREVLQLLTKHPDIANKYFKPVGKQVHRRSLQTLVGIAGVLVSLVGQIYVIYSSTNYEEHGSFESQIQVVDANLDDLMALERSLLALKKELQATSKESAQIKMEYEEALKLKTITSEQLEQIKKVVSSKSVSDTFLNYSLGFLLGVAGSVLATVITDKWKTKQS